MGFKDLWVTSEEKASDKPKKPEPVKEAPKTKFPTSTEAIEPPIQSSGFNFGFAKTTPSSNSGQINPEHLAKAVEVYKNGFDSLNQPGYDFYEFYQAVMSTGAENAQIYPMAFAMGKSMEKNITKDSLLQQADFYTSEIGKVYNDYITKGNTKKQELIDSKNHENQSLVGELELMHQQMEQLKIQIQDRENKLQAIGGKYEPKLNEIDSKLAANDTAKSQLIQSIEQVKQGIINNLK